jgi:AcrR family transcriptional regulator
VKQQIVDRVAAADMLSDMPTPPVETPAPQAEPIDPAVTRILDAALEQFEDVGIRKSTVEDIARRAGVDRVTVYRRVGSKNDIAQAVVARDAQRLLARVAAGIADKESLEDRVVAAFIGMMVGLRDHALFNRLVRLEPNETLPRVTTEASSMLATGIHQAVDLLIPADAGAEARANLTARIEIVGRFIHSSMLTKQGALSLDSKKQLADFARTYIVPIVAGALPA